jgi:hypothetical protein
MNQSRMTWWPNQVGRINISSGSRTATSLNAAFVNGTSGPAVSIRWMAQTTDPIDELYVFLDSNGGTLGSITMQALVLNENSQTRPGTTVRATSTATVMPAAVDRWVKFTFGTPYTPAIGEILWLTVHNTSASPTVDFPGILTSTNTYPPQAPLIGYAACILTSNGFTTNGLTASEMPFVLKCGSNYFGSPFTQFVATSYANNQRQRGIVVTSTEDVVVMGVSFNNTSASYDELKIYDNSTAPGATALATYDLDSVANATTADVCGGTTFAPFTLTGGLTYKVVLTFAANATTPGIVQIEDYASYSSVFDALRDNDTIGNPWGCIDDGAGGWTIDKSICPALALYVDDSPAIPSGGGGGGRIIS